MPALYLRPIDPTDPHGLLTPSPGGGTVPAVDIYDCGNASHGRWLQPDGDGWKDPPLCSSCSARRRWHGGLALVLRTADGTADPIGMARAREVLARVAPSSAREEGIALGVSFAPSEHPDCGPGWGIYTPWESTYLKYAGELTRPEDAPEALAAILAHLGVCEVIRG